MDRTLKNLIGFFAGILAICFVAKAMGAEPSPRDMGPPQASFGVMQCGEVVAIWVITKDGKLFRTDAEHHPDTPAEYNAFLSWLATAQEDLYTLPCPTAKQHTKEIP